MSISQFLYKSSALLGFVALLLALQQGTASAQEAQPSPAPRNQTAGGQVQPTAPLPPKEQPGVKAPGKTQEGEDKRVLGVLPNYRTAEMNAVGHPLTAEQKFKIASKDSFDYPLIFLGAAYAGLYQLENNHPEFGQGVKGYFRRFGTSYCDQVTGNMMTEGFLPVLLKEDPRYFRMAEGSKSSRFMYAVSRILVTRTDSGNKTFNFAEVLGNGMAAGIGLSYYPDDRDVRDYMQNWGIQLATDAGSQVLKEFWPDIKGWWHARHHKMAQ
jgi:hypothetical protein